MGDTPTRRRVDRRRRRRRTAGGDVPALARRASAWQAFSVLDVVLALLRSCRWRSSSSRRRRSPSLPVAFSVFSVVAGAVAALLILYRIANLPGPNHAVDVQVGAWLGLAAAVLVAAGGWRSLRVEPVRGVPVPPVENLPAPAP
jgi:hypothetical protein